MSKAIYYLKLALLANQYQMSGDEKKEVETIAEFVALFYAKAFLQSSHATLAPLNDLKIMIDMKEYTRYQPVTAKACMKSCNRHLWYLTPQLVVLCLAAKDIPVQLRETVAQKLWQTPRENNNRGEFHIAHIVFITFNNNLNTNIIISSTSKCLLPVSTNVISFLCIPYHIRWQTSFSKHRLVAGV